MKGIFTLVGMHHQGARELVFHMPKMSELYLQREPNNPHDPNAVQVWTGPNATDGEGNVLTPRMLGYIKGTEVGELARFLDARGHDQCLARLTVTGNYAGVKVDL